MVGLLSIQLITKPQVSFYLIKIAETANTEETLSDEILSILNYDDKPETFGLPVNPAVAKRYENIMAKCQEKECMDKLKDKIQIPENCEFFCVPKVNQEIWSQLPIKSRSNDAKLQYSQQNSAKSLAAFAQITEEITKIAKSLSKESCEKILKLCLDGAMFAARQHQELSVKRRHAMKPVFTPQVSAICQGYQRPGRYLFGENLTETLRTSRSITNIVRYNTTHRFVPYQNPRQAGNSLNYRGQFRQQYRGSLRNRPFQNKPRWTPQTKALPPQ